MSNEAAERRYDPPAWASDSEVRAYGMGFAAERKATVERIRAAYVASHVPASSESFYQGIDAASANLFAILDAEAAR